ncbi:beta-lactamase domain protein [Alkaliphilus metalliredigens QYMF]|uniref:Beta-lactamase domain protein n=1 Tax=Alkaliphilus metalliredigens (strain QYMF) TaxID=293826 RepID=A6TXA0_ALKMQ|nr:MBL fold metallo-hydrolase [Alkaliphilus metalliredigens]ABR50818.1 beta-lactamase domain protein [Alkaliphilus metalliredigens QYMF]
MAMTFCSLASGSSGNCHLISDGKEHLLVDAGLSGKQIESRLKDIGMNPKDLTGILVSHEHRDHILGVGILSRRYNLPVYANEGTWKGMADKVGKVKEEHICFFDQTRDFKIGKLTVSPFSISHDAKDPVGFCFQGSNAKISIATDLGHIDEEILNKVGNSDLVVLESNHDVEMLKIGQYPYALKRRVLSDVGHLSNDAAGDAIVDLVKRNVKAILLAHLSKENNFPELAMITVKNILQSNEMIIGRDIEVSLAERNRVSMIYQY